ncbi:hypothetical protein MMYC01_206073 [Madurella mycetomatis]|uniref:Uncharacterized protein n=1 Tax=Madurella mycetomatis TaxID=100816 RepID=A0A175W1T1_9PEZI|nr:hypothetical protein MMYC01_206073 [Madurella mycetomatis]
MENPDPNDAVFDPELDARFSDLAMAGGSPTQGETFSNTTTDADTSTFWPDQDTSISADPATTKFGDFDASPQHATTFATQSPGGLNNAELEEYSQHMASPAYWHPESGDAGSSSDLPFACPYEGCTNAYHRQCDLDGEDAISVTAAAPKQRT